MKVDFSGDEIKIYNFDELEAYKIARKLEEDGIFYYSRMKEEVLKPTIRDVVEILISDERKHLSVFEEKVEELSRKHKVLDDGETLPDIVDSHVMDVLKDTDRVAGILCNPQEALKLGISVERRSIAFYNEILRNTHDESGRAAIEELIADEQKHVERLEGLVRK